jgi:hypothetical protein
MAEIKVQRKGVPWWAWLLLAILAIVLIWWAVEAFSGDDADEEMAPPATDAAVVDTAPVAAPGSPDGAAGERITDIGALLDAEDPTALVGREVRLEDVRVLEMVGDATFWVGRGANDRMFVILDEQIPSPPPDVEGRVNVNAGQTVDIMGAVRASGDLPGGGVLDQTGRTAAGEGPVYIWARSATVATRP